MKQEKRWVYDKDVCMPDMRCDSYPIYEDSVVIFNVILSEKDEYYLEAGIKENKDSEERIWVFVSMERPEFIQEPYRSLNKLEKDNLTIIAKIRWKEILKTIIDQCTNDCVNRGGGCNKFFTRTLPPVPPDYTMLPDLK